MPPREISKALGAVNLNEAEAKCTLTPNQSETLPKTIWNAPRERSGSMPNGGGQEQIVVNINL